MHMHNHSCVQSCALSSFSVYCLVAHWWHFALLRFFTAFFQVTAVSLTFQPMEMHRFLVPLLGMKSTTLVAQGINSLETSTESVKVMDNGLDLCHLVLVSYMCQVVVDNWFCHYATIMMPCKRPLCISLGDCQTVSSPPNGRANVSGTTVGYTVTYSCNPEYKLIGISNRTCQDSGEWSGTPPSCSRKLWAMDDSIDA